MALTRLYGNYLALYDTGLILSDTGFKTSIKKTAAPKLGPNESYKAYSVKWNDGTKTDGHVFKETPDISPDIGSRVEENGKKGNITNIRKASEKEIELFEKGLQITAPGNTITFYTNDRYNEYYASQPVPLTNDVFNALKTILAPDRNNIIDTGKLDSHIHTLFADGALQHSKKTTEKPTLTNQEYDIYGTLQKGSKNAFDKDKPLLIIDNDATNSPLSLFVIENPLAIREINNILRYNNEKNIHTELQSKLNVMEHTYDAAKVLAYGLEGETELLVENNFGNLDLQVEDHFQRYKTNDSVQFLYDSGILAKINARTDIDGNANDMTKGVFFHPSNTYKSLDSWLKNKRTEMKEWEKSQIKKTGKIELGKTTTEQFLEDANKLFADRIGKLKSIFDENTSLAGANHDRNNYSVNSKEKTIFTGINQLLCQQFRMDNNLIDHNFFKLNGDKTYQIKKGEKGLLLIDHDPVTNTNKLNLYYNHDQALTYPEPVPTRILDNKDVDIRFINMDKTQTHAYEILQNEVNNYISCITQHKSHQPTPGFRNPEHHREIVNQLKSGDISLAKAAQTATNLLISQNKNTQKNMQKETKTQKKGRA